MRKLKKQILIKGKSLTDGSCVSGIDKCIDDKNQQQQENVDSVGNSHAVVKIASTFSQFSVVIAEHSVDASEAHEKQGQESQNSDKL